MQVDLREVLRTEKRGSGPRNHYYVLDNRGANSVEVGPFETFSLAQDEWRRQASNIMLEWTAPTVSNQTT